MGHAVRIRSREQYIEALRVLDRMPGTWRGIGPASDPVLLLRWMCQRRLDGITGDCLGAAIEMSEVLFLISAVVVGVGSGQ